MRRLASFAVVLVAALSLAGCGAKDEGVTVQAGQGPSTADIDAQIAKIQADTHMPDFAKQAQVAQLQTAKARAASAARK